MRFRYNPGISELLEILKLLKEKQVIIGYHGTTVEQAQKILSEGFKLANVRDIIKEAYEITGIGWKTRKKLPSWARRSIESEIKARIFEKYFRISFGPYGVASRWAGKGGEILHETVRNINVIKAFWKTDHPKTQQEFEAWISGHRIDSPVSTRYFYQNLGEPIILKAYIQLSQKRAEHLIITLESMLKWAEEDKDFDPWSAWNENYQDWTVDDPKKILHIEVADSPQPQPKFRNPDSWQEEYKCGYCKTIISKDDSGFCSIECERAYGECPGCGSPSRGNKLCFDCRE